MVGWLVGWLVGCMFVRFLQAFVALFVGLAQFSVDSRRGGVLSGRHHDQIRTPKKVKLGQEMTESRWTLWKGLRGQNLECQEYPPVSSNMAGKSPN